ncbi:MAG: hypothetical protein AAFN79_13010 [Pseudomonadota bacterium]
MAQALDRAVEERNAGAAAEAHFFLAGLRMSPGRRREALRHAQSAARLFREAGDPDRMYRALRLQRTAEALARIG